MTPEEEQRWRGVRRFDLIKLTEEFLLPPFCHSLSPGLDVPKSLANTRGKHKEPLHCLSVGGSDLRCALFDSGKFSAQNIPRS